MPIAYQRPRNPPISHRKLVLQRSVGPLSHRGSSVSLIPNSRSRCRVRLVWPSRARAFRRCVRAIFAAVFSSRAFEGRWPSHQHGIKAAIPVWTWHSVSSGFSPPESLPHPRQEEITDRTDDQVTFQPQVATALVMVPPDLTLVVLEAPLHAPPREGDSQQGPQRSPGRCVAEEVLDLRRVQDVAGDDQV